MEEYELYGLSSFVADVGGFLGLLLGASLLSIICQAHDFVTKKIMKKRS